MTGATLTSGTGDDALASVRPHPVIANVKTTRRARRMNGRTLVEKNRLIWCIQ
jgi:hypothetical protein